MPSPPKVALGVRQWRPERCIGQLRLPGCNTDAGLPDMTVAEGPDGRRGDPDGGGWRTAAGIIAESWIEVLREGLEAGMDLAAGLQSNASPTCRCCATPPRARGRSLFDVRFPTHAFPIGNGKRRRGRQKTNRMARPRTPRDRADERARRRAGELRMSRIVYVNGGTISPRSTRRSRSSTGAFLFADGVYEVSSVLDGRLVDNRAHLARPAPLARRARHARPGQRGRDRARAAHPHRTQSAARGHRVPPDHPRRRRPGLHLPERRDAESGDVHPGAGTGGPPGHADRRQGDLGAGHPLEAARPQDGGAARGLDGQAGRARGRSGRT